jgi:hypothetical protein
MTDREMLELAAKAAGIKLADEVDSYIPGSRAMWVVGPGGRDAVWNPFNDDGDALRLAVKLDISLLGHFPFDAVVSHEGRRILEKKLSGDPMPATRRAIVRAAAEIGKAMP